MSSSKLARFVVLAYTLAIVYASLQPFTGWREPPEAVRNFLTAAWPRYITVGDIMLNVAAYLPLGILLFASMRPALRPSVAWALATLISAALSLGMESLQMFLPTRIASNVDLLTNTLGGGLGALAAWLLILPVLANNPLSNLRRRWIRRGALGDAGLIIIGLWLLIQFDPAQLTLGNGDVRELFSIASAFEPTAMGYLLAETIVVAAALITIGLLASLVIEPRQPTLPMISLILLFALIVKSTAEAILSGPEHWLQWLTPGLVAGFIGGSLVLALLLMLPAVGRIAVALLCIICVVVIVNATPENPYQTTSALMLKAPITHLFSFSQIVHTAAQLWPIIALVFLVVVAFAPRAVARASDR